MICSSLNLLRFILVRLLCVGLYQKPVTFQGSTSPAFNKKRLKVRTWALNGSIVQFDITACRFIAFSRFGSLPRILKRCLSSISSHRAISDEVLPQPIQNRVARSSWQSPTHGDERAADSRFGSRRSCVIAVILRRMCNFYEANSLGGLTLH